MHGPSWDHSHKAQQETRIFWPIILLSGAKLIPCPTWRLSLSIPAWISVYKSMIETFPINGERVVPVEHAMFKFDDLKVNSHYDRQNDKQNKEC